MRVIYLIRGQWARAGGPLGRFGRRAPPPRAAGARTPARASRSEAGGALYGLCSGTRGRWRCGRRGIDRTVLATRQSGNESFRKARAPVQRCPRAPRTGLALLAQRRSNERAQGAIAAWRPRGERARAAGVARATYFVSCLIAAPPAASACQHATPCTLRRRARRCRAVDEPERRRAVLGDAHGRAVDEDRGEIALAPRLHPGARACGARSPARGRSVREGLGRASEPKWHTAPLLSIQELGGPHREIG